MVQALLIELVILASGARDTGWYLVLLRLPLLILAAGLVTAATPARLAVAYAAPVRRAEANETGRFAPIWATRLRIRMLVIAIILLVAGVILFSVGETSPTTLSGASL